MLRVTRLVFLLVLLLGSRSLQAQRANCEEVLQAAQTEFDAGHFNVVSSRLKDCIDGGFSRDQRFRAYLLLTQVYLYIDDPIAAENSYIEVLKADPEFIPTEEEYPIDVVYLSRRFTSNPVFTVYPKVGMNTSMIRVIHDLGTNYSNASKDEYKLKLGWQIGFGFDLNITDQLSLCGELLYSRKLYDVFTDGIFPYDPLAMDAPVAPAESDPGDVLTVTEKQQWVNLPFYLKYADYKGDLRPYGYAGFALGWLAAANAEVRASDITYETTNTFATTEGPDINVGQQRATLGKSLVFGGGVRRKFGRDFLSVDVRYMMGLNNLVLTDKLYTQATETVYRYGYVSDLFALNNLSISFGYIRPLYAPRLKPKPKTFFKDLFGKGGKGGKE